MATRSLTTVVGIPKEIKSGENRVGMTPAGVAALVADGHKVLVQKDAGLGSGIPNDAFTAAGAKLIDTAAEVWKTADMIVKVKEPVKEELTSMRPGQLCFGYFHFASGPELTKACIKSKAVCLAFETVTTPKRDHPLLTPMSEVAGRIAAHQGAFYLEKHRGGMGVLVGGVPGVLPAKVLVIGGGVVGTQSAKLLAGLGGDVIIMDNSNDRLKELENILPKNVKTLYSNRTNLISELKNADLVIGGVYISGAKAPHLVTKADLKLMKKGSVVIDVCVDQGGCFESTKPTTHENPTFVEEGVVHYCVANMPGAVARTSTFALANATLPYARTLASKGWKAACKADVGLKAGLNVVEGKVTIKGVSSALGYEYVDPDTLL